MGLVAKLRALLSGSKTAPAATSPAEEPQGELITVYDAYGREYQITKSEWRQNVLPGQLAEARDDPDALYDVLALALQDGFCPPLLEASARLLEIDRRSERSHVLRAIVLMMAGNLNGAEEVLSGYIEDQGATGLILTNLAKIRAERGQAELSKATLWQALQLDPNQENGLLWWASLHQVQPDDDGFYAAMRQVAGLPGSWRPQLWLARQALRAGRFEEARRHYDHALSVAADGPGVLMMISGDLGNAGLLAEMLELVLPLFDPQRHDARAGLNLLQACLTLQNLEAGEPLLHRLFALNRPDLKDALYHYANQFEQQRAAQQLPRDFAPEELTFSTVPIERPIWAYGLHDARWLFPDEDAAAEPDVVFLTLANTTAASLSGPRLGREDDLGRLTRSLPLYWMEAVHAWTELRPKLIVPMIEGGGVVVFGQEWTEQRVFDMAGEARWAVSGSIAQDDEKLWIRLTLWDCAEHKIAKILQQAASPAELGEAVLRLEQDLLAQLLPGGARSTPRVEFYRRPPAELLPHYLACLGQSLMLSVVQAGAVPKESLWGERNMLGQFLGLALQEPTFQGFKLMFLSGLAKSHGIGSTAYLEYRREALQMLADEQNSASPADRVSPLVYRIFDPEQFHLRRAELLKTAHGPYRDWLQGLTLDA